MTLNSIKHLFDRNAEWAREIKKQNPEFFSDLSKQQAPEYLWIGCSDSRVPANQIVKLPPGEVQLDLFLQTSEQDGFFLMAKNLDMREVMAEEGTNMDELPDCGGFQ